MTLLALALPAPAVQSSTLHSSYASASAQRKVYVKGYFRRNGTYVHPYVHSVHSRACPTCPRDEHGRIKRDPKARKAFMRWTGYPHGRPGYVVDHIIPLECGGADSPANMQWQTIAEAKAKDKAEGHCPE
jgi:hypothetical protein